MAFTRSQSKNQPLIMSLLADPRILNHDFDDSHNEWIANKKKKDGLYEYMCGKDVYCRKTKQQKKCSRSCCDKLGIYNGCRIHFNWK